MAFSLSSLRSSISGIRSSVQTVRGIYDDVRDVRDQVRGIPDRVRSSFGSSFSETPFPTNGSITSPGDTGGQAGTSLESVTPTLMPFYMPQVDPSHPMYPIVETGGLVFPYTPTISETTAVNYESVQTIHSNESQFSYRNTDNTRISISDCYWTCDTFSSAVYALAVLHFFRATKMMDFGRGSTGRPPSPMWFSAYGNYCYNRVPVLMERGDIAFPNDVDYVGVPNFGTDEYQNGFLNTDNSFSSGYSWIPAKLTISGISLIVQHSPHYWSNWSLDDYWAGRALDHRVHESNPVQSNNVFTDTSPVATPSDQTSTPTITPGQPQ